jgi:glutamate racemase
MVATQSESEAWLEMPSSAPIGVFDSGVGGLAVLHDIRRQLPHEDLIYLADSAYAPYGDRSEAWIEARCATLVELLVQRRAKAIVVACNTATAVAIRSMRAAFALPIIAMEPAVKVAVEHTRTRSVAVLATTRTLSSDNFRRLQTLFGDGVTFFAQPCPGLADQVEAGELSGATTRALLEKYVRPVVDRGVDTLVLGCTHYSFLREHIQAVAGPHVSIVDPAPAIARQLQRRLAEAGLLAERARPGSERFLTTDALEHARSVIAKLWLADTGEGLSCVAGCSELELERIDASLL